MVVNLGAAMTSSILTTRKLASGQNLACVNGNHERIEKIYFRQHTEILSHMLQSDIRYCPSYKRGFPGSYSDVASPSRASRESLTESPVWSHSNNMAVSPSPLERPPRQSPTILTNYTVNKKNTVGDRNSGYKTLVTFENKSSEKKNDSKRGFSKTPKVFLSNDGIWKPSAAVSRDPFSKVTRSRTRLDGNGDADDEDGLDTNRRLSRSRRELVRRSGRQRILYFNEGQISKRLDSTDESEFDNEGSLSLGRASESSNQLASSRQHNTSIQCDILGPLACKFCTRRLSIANASLTLANRETKSQWGVHSSCPLCLAEQQKSSERINPPSSSSPPSYPSAQTRPYTPLELFLRVRNRKLIEGERGAQSDSSCPSLKELGDTESTNVKRGDRGEVEWQRENTESDNLESRRQASDINEGSVNSSLEVHDHGFDGMRITVIYLNHNKE